MKVFSVFGTTNTGKTTTVENIIKELRRRGYTVGSVKDIHYEKFNIDPDEERDTNRHKIAGSDLVTARGFHETDILYKGRLEMKEILKHYDTDYVVLEGVRDFNVPSIICAREEEYIEANLDDRVLLISGVISNQNNEYKGIPIINSNINIKSIVDKIEEFVPHVMPNVDKKCCNECGYSCEEMLAKIVKGEAKEEDCLLLDSYVELKIDGKEISMVPFVRKILSNAIKAVIKELDGYKPNSKIEIKI